MERALPPLSETDKQSIPNEDALARDWHRLAVGWQKLTRQEFLDAISATLIASVQRHESERSAKLEQLSHDSDEPARSSIPGEASLPRRSEDPENT